MKKLIKSISFDLFNALLLTFMLSYGSGVFAQSTYSGNATKVTISGTSTLHDWDMVSSSGMVTFQAETEGDKVTKISGLSFKVKAETLKSSKSGLDNNAYKALDTKKHTEIRFNSNSVIVSPTGDKSFIAKATGTMEIKGAKKTVTIEAKGVYNPAEKSITFNGDYSFNMTEYGVQPPTVMMGTIKTGDKIKIDYNLKALPQK